MTDSTPPTEAPLTKEERDSIGVVVPKLGMLPRHEEIQTLRGFVGQYEATVVALEDRIEALEQKLHDERDGR